MIKLYRAKNGQTEYWESWESGNSSAVIHWGVIGEEGENKTVTSKLLKSYKKQVQKEMDLMLADGFSEIDEDDFRFLEIEYKIEGFGTEEDIEKRHRLENKVNEVLGWTGLGHCDGGSIGTGTMEVGCLVVDFEVAKRTIEQKLKGTEFADYSRIYDMSE